MASNLDDFIKAGQVFSEGISNLAVNTALRDANQQITEINSNVTDEKEKFAAMNQLGQSLAMRLMGAGADASQIASTAGKMQVSAGQQAQITASEESQSRSQDFTAEQNQLERDLRRELAMLRAAQKARKDSEGKDLTRGDRKDIIDTNKAINQADFMMNQFERLSKDVDLPLVGPGSGGGAGPVGEWIREKFSSKYADFQKLNKRFRNTYQKWLSGAQVSDREREIIRASLPNEDDRPETYKRALMTYKWGLQREKQNQLETMEKSNLNVSQFKDDMSKLSQEQRLFNYAMQHKLEGNEDTARKIFQRLGIEPKE